jgi:hypothetical protein
MYILGKKNIRVFPALEKAANTADSRNAFRSAFCKTIFGRQFT